MEERPDLYALAETHHVTVFHRPMPGASSLSAEVNGHAYICLDTTRGMTAAAEAAHLGHELGHCLYGGFYTRSTAFDTVERHEVRADRWYIRHAIPRKTLFRLLRQGRDAWEIAELLNTTEDYVRRAYYFYKENP